MDSIKRERRYFDTFMKSSLGEFECGLRPHSLLPRYRYVKAFDCFLVLDGKSVIADHYIIAEDLKRFQPCSHFGR